MPIFLLVLFGLFDGGKLVFTNSTLSQAAREGARLAASEGGWIEATGGACVADASAIGPGNPGAHVCPAGVAAYKAHIVSAVNRMAVTVGPIAAVHISCNEGTVSDPAPSGDWTELSGGNGCKDGSGNAISARDDLVSVRIEHTYQPFTPIVSSIMGPITLSGSATMVIN